MASYSFITVVTFLISFVSARAAYGPPPPAYFSPTLSTFFPTPTWNATFNATGNATGPTGSLGPTAMPLSTGISGGTPIGNGTLINGTSSALPPLNATATPPFGNSTASPSVIPLFPNATATPPNLNNTGSPVFATPPFANTTAPPTPTAPITTIPSASSPTISSGGTIIIIPTTTPGPSTSNPPVYIPPVAPTGTSTLTLPSPLPSPIQPGPTLPACGTFINAGARNVFATTDLFNGNDDCFLWNVEFNSYVDPFSTNCNSIPVPVNSAVSRCGGALQYSTPGFTVNPTYPFPYYEVYFPVFDIAGPAPVYTDPIRVSGNIWTAVPWSSNVTCSESGSGPVQCVVGSTLGCVNGFECSGLQGDR